MKQLYLILFSCCLFTAKLWAQPAYPPAPPAVANLLKAEFFFDNDPGIGNGTSLPLPALQDVQALNAALQLSGAALTPGIHLLYIRTQDANGVWSLTQSLLFDNFALPAYPPGGVTPNLIAGEYFIDADPGLGLGRAFLLPAAPDVPSQMLSIDVNGLTPGQHVLYVRVKDNAGKWSLCAVHVFDNSATVPYPVAPGPAQPITKIEYFFDTDPGHGAGIPLAVGPSADIQLHLNPSVASLPAGNHVAYFRTAGSDGKWSLTGAIPFTKPAFELSLDSLIFENTAVASTRRLTLSFTNNDQNPQTVQSIDLPAPFSTSLIAPFTVAPGQTFQLPVDFSPVIAGSYADTLRVQTSDGLYRIVMKGEGISVLPLRVVDFRVSASGSTASISWTTMEESGIDSFTVEHSFDQRRFSGIGTLPARNVAGRHQYSITHPLLFGQHFYRVKIMERDGRVSYTGVKQLFYGNRQSLQVFPNPAKNQVRIVLPGDFSGGGLSIYDAGGKLMKSIQNVDAGRQWLELNVTGWQPGVYLVTVQKGERQQTLYFVKQ